jgi:hypothetical protein
MSNIFNRMIALREERLRNPHGTAIRMAIQAARINGQSDEYIRNVVLTPMAQTIPAGTYLLVEQDYDSEDDNESLLKGLEKEGWAYPISLWTGLLDAFHQWQEEQEVYRGLTEGWEKIRAIRQTGLSKALKAIMPEGWEVNRREYVEPDEERGFYVTVGSEDASHMYEVTFNLKNKMRLIVPVFVDYEPDTEDFDLLIIEDATDLVAGFASELSPTNLSELSETIDVDRK